MSKELNNIDRLVREQLDGFEMAPPPEVWTKTEAALAQSRRKKPFFWFFLGFVLIGSIGLGIYYFNSDNSTKNETSQLAKNHSGSSENETSASGEMKPNSSKTPQTRQANSSGLIKSTTNRDDPKSTSLLSKKSSDQQFKNPKSNATNGINLFKSKGDESGEIDLRKGKSDSDNDLSILQKTEDDLDLTKNDGLSKSQMSLPDEQNSPRNSGNISNEIGSESIGRITELGSLPFRAINPFLSPKFTAVQSDFEEDSLPKTISIWKKFSLEMALGISTFENYPSKKTTETELASLLKNASSREFGTDFHFGLNYHLTSRISFQTGLEYSKMKENYTFESSYFDSYTYLDSTIASIDSSTLDTTYAYVTISVDSLVIVTNEAKNTYTIFAIPFQFAWNTSIGKRGLLEFGLGGSLSVYGKNNGFTIQDTQANATTSSEAIHTKGILSVGGSVKYLYQFGSHHAAYIEPWIRFGITNQSTPALQYESYRRNLGIRFGYRFYF